MSLTGQSLNPFSGSFPILATLLNLTLHSKRESRS